MKRIHAIIIFLNEQNRDKKFKKNKKVRKKEKKRRASIRYHSCVKSVDKKINNNASMVPTNKCSCKKSYFILNAFVLGGK